MQVADLSSRLAEAQRKHEAARRLYDAEAQVTTQSAELLKRGELEQQALQRRLQEQASRVERAQTKAAELREELQAARVR